MPKQTFWPGAASCLSYRLTLACLVSPSVRAPKSRFKARWRAFSLRREKRAGFECERVDVGNSSNDCVSSPILSVRCRRRADLWSVAIGQGAAHASRRVGPAPLVQMGLLPRAVAPALRRQPLPAPGSRRFGLPVGPLCLTRSASFCAIIAGCRHSSLQS